jgi:hypothetical protein
VKSALPSFTRLPRKGPVAASCMEPTGTGRSDPYTRPRNKNAILEIVYFWKFDTKFSFKSIELVEWNLIFNQQAQK